MAADANGANAQDFNHLRHDGVFSKGDSGHFFGGDLSNSIEWDLELYLPPT
jgi:hypothetical protein